MAGDNIYQLKLGYNLPRNEPALNVFWYHELPGGAGNASDLAATFRTSLLGAIRPVLPNNVTLTFMQTLNTHQFSDNEIFTAFGAPLGLADAAIDKTAAIAFRRREGGIGTRYSYKRFPAPGNYNIDGWTNSGATFYPAVNALILALGAVLVGVGASYEPVQVKGGWTMECTASNPTYCGQGQVLMNGDLDGNWQVDKYPSHQTSRDDRLWQGSL